MAYILLATKRTNDKQENRVHNVIQQNLMHCVAAQDLLGRAVREEGIDVILISEPAKKPLERCYTWQASIEQSAVIVACGTEPINEVRCQAEGMVVADVGGITYASCYAPPRWNFIQFQYMLRRMETTLRDCPKVVVGGDFNAWHTAWGCVRNNKRGSALLRAIKGMGLVCANVGSIPTFMGNLGAAKSVLSATTSKQVENKGDAQVTIINNQDQYLPFVSIQP